MTSLSVEGWVVTTDGPEPVTITARALDICARLQPRQAPGFYVFSGRELTTHEQLLLNITDDSRILLVTLRDECGVMGICWFEAGSASAPYSEQDIRKVNAIAPWVMLVLRTTANATVECFGLMATRALARGTIQVLFDMSCRRVIWWSAPDPSEVLSAAIEADKDLLGEIAKQWLAPETDKLPKRPSLRCGTVVCVAPVVGPRSQPWAAIALGGKSPKAALTMSCARQ